MVRTLSKIAIAFGILLALLLALLAVLLPRLIESDEIQTTLRARATEALGTPVDWNRLEVGLLPPRLVLETPRLLADSAAEGWGLSADSIDLRLSLGGLLRRRVEIDSLVLKGVELVVTRTADGLQLPLVAAGSESSAPDGVSSPDAPSTPSPADARPSEAPADARSSEAPAGDPAPSRVALDLHRLVIEGGRIVLRDRTLVEPIEWQLEDLRLEARGSGSESGGSDPIGIDASARLFTGAREIGALATTGTLTRTGVYELEITVEELLLRELAAYLPDLALEGRLSGRISLDGAGTTPTRTDVDLRVQGIGLSGLGLDLGGELALEAHRTGVDPVDFVAGLDLAGNGGEVRLEGRLELDGAVDATARFDAVDLAVLAPMLEAGTRVEGALTGRLDLRMKADRTIERMDTDLRIETARVRHAPVDLTGTAALVMRLEGAGPASVEGRLQLTDGGRLDLKGTATLDGVLDVAGEIERFDLGIASPFLPGPEMEIDGLATGKLRLLGAVTAPERIGLDVSVETGRLRIPDYAVDGPFSLKLEVKEPISARRRGTLDLDLTAARVGYRDQFVKRAGMRAEMASRFMPDAKGEIVFESRIKLHDIDEILLQGRVGESISVVVTTPTFELEGWSEVFPALAAYAPAGPIAMEGLGVELIPDAPMRFGGRLRLGGVGLTLPGAGRVRLRGQLLGEGTALRTQSLEMWLGGATLAVVGRIDDPLDGAHYELELKSVGASEVNALLRALDSTPDTLFGPLELDGRISGQARDAADFRRSVEGRFAFTVGREGGGRLRGVSILRRFLDQVPVVGDAARLTQTLRGGDSIQSYLSERFEIIEGRFELGGGRVEAQTLRLAYRGYEVHLSGPLQLEDLSIDMKGEILLKSDLVSALAGSSGSGAASGRQPIRIPLARVTNTLADPKLRMTPETLAAVPRLLIQATGLDALSTGVGKALGRVLGGARDGN